MMIKKHLDMLGVKVEDRVTGMKGVITSISFDLYGCVQAVINPGLDKDEKPRDGMWMDVARFKVLDTTPVMARPDFIGDTKQAAGLQGPAEKPRARF
jgi:hypothetical protein